jgi:hypothetical protein
LMALKGVAISVAAAAMMAGSAQAQNTRPAQRGQTAAMRWMRPRRLIGHSCKQRLGHQVSVQTAICVPISTTRSDGIWK